MDAPAYALALMRAYHEATGYELTITYQRSQNLQMIHEMGITPDQVIGVIRELKRLMRDQPKTYTETCLAWRNCMDPDKLEERVAVLKQREARKRKPPRVEIERKVGKDVVKFLVDEPQRDPQLIGSLINLKSTIRNS